MMWHSQYRQTEKPHEDYWYQDTEENLMKEYINRHSDESVLTVLDELRRDAIYSCSDPRMHIKERAQVTKLTMMQLNVTRKTSRTAWDNWWIFFVIVDTFLTVWFFKCWPWDIWELVYLTLTLLTRIILTEVWRPSHVCFGTSEIADLPGWGVLDFFSAGGYYLNK